MVGHTGQVQIGQEQVGQAERKNNHSMKLMESTCTNDRVRISTYL